MNNWREFKFTIIDNDINQAFKNVDCFIKEKRLTDDYFIIIKRPNIYLRIKYYNGTDFDKVYEPEYYQFGGESSWNIVAKYLKIATLDKLKNNDLIVKNYYGYARGILDALISNCDQKELQNVIKSLKLARPLSKDVNDCLSRSVLIKLPKFQKLPILLKNENSAAFPPDKILPFVIIFAFNIYDIPIKTQIKAIYDFFEGEGGIAAGIRRIKSVSE